MAGISLGKNNCIKKTQPQGSSSLKKMNVFPFNLNIQSSHIFFFFQNGTVMMAYIRTLVDNVFEIDPIITPKITAKFADVSFYVLAQYCLALKHNQDL